MKKLLLITASALCLVACGGGGGGDAVIQTAQSGVVTTPLPVNTQGLHIVRPGTAFDGYDGGLAVTRDTTGQSGGTAGYVNTAAIFHSVAGKDVRQFEWNVLALLDNYSNFGENAAAYFQANKFGEGPTFGAVTEVTNVNGIKGAAVTHEFDNWTTGKDTGDRYGLDVLVGDARFIRGFGRTFGPVEGTSAVHIAATTATPWASWAHGVEIDVDSVRQSPVILHDRSGRVVFEVRSNGDIYRRGVLLP
jgi:hypothetical protein